MHFQEFLLKRVPEVAAQVVWVNELNSLSLKTKKKLSTASSERRFSFLKRMLVVCRRATNGEIELKQRGSQSTWTCKPSVSAAAESVIRSPSITLCVTNRGHFELAIRVYYRIAFVERLAVVLTCQSSAPHTISTARRGRRFVCVTDGEWTARSPRSISMPNRCFQW